MSVASALVSAAADSSSLSLSPSNIKSDLTKPRDNGGLVSRRELVVATDDAALATDSTSLVFEPEPLESVEATLFNREAFNQNRLVM